MYRFVNYNDAVTHVPTDSLLYKQTPKPSYRFTMNGDLDLADDSGYSESLLAAFTGPGESMASMHLGFKQNLNTVNAPPSLVDHSPARY